ncbi:Cof-type HAD-IIB family hydrolase [Ruminococcaceae bacterium OttesenSCG-928-A16]|nr:Cof-type HAD-IIB family hydrolase [Ruminococcaceae bacterium OttesenSCG-928-A16]
MVEAIFFDIDGTLLSFETHEMTPAVAQALRSLHQKGIKLFIATGRHAAQVEFMDEIVNFDGYITLNGQICYDENGTIYQQHINEKDVAELTDRMEKMDIPCYYVQKDDTFVNKLDDRLKSLEDTVDITIPPQKDPKEIEDLRVYQLVAFLSPQQEQELLAGVNNVETTRWHPLFVDIIPKGGSKQVGIQKVLAQCGIARKNTMAFGDGGNDMEMLQYVQTGIAMGNASDDLKAVADYVTDTVDNDGVVKALKHFGLL